MGAFPIVNENDTVATDEIRFGDNDRLAALVAHLVHADLLVLLSDVDGVYDGDPSKPGTSRIAEVRGPGDLAHVEIGSAGKAGVGTGGMVTKVEAAGIAAAAGVPVVLTSAVHAAEALVEAGTPAPTSTPPASGPPTGCCGSSTPPPRRARSPSTTARSGRSSSAASRCCPRASPPSTATSAPVTRSSCATAPDARSPEGSSTSTPRRSPSSSAARPTSWPASWAPPTSGRSSTATTWSSCADRPRPGRRAVRRRPGRTGPSGESNGPYRWGTFRETAPRSPAACSTLSGGRVSGTRPARALRMREGGRRGTSAPWDAAWPVAARTTPRRGRRGRSAP